MAQPQVVVKPRKCWLPASWCARWADEKIEQYIVTSCMPPGSPNNKLADLASPIAFGGSPRASINMALAAKALAFTKRRGYAIPRMYAPCALDVLRHRLGLTLRGRGRGHPGGRRSSTGCPIRWRCLEECVNKEMGM